MKSGNITKRLCVVGSTGLIGTAVLQGAVGRTDVRIVGVARREVALPPGARMEMLLADPVNWDQAIAASNAEVLVCALGTTIRKQDGNQEAFRAIDLDLVLYCARAAREAGIDHMIVVSSVGADSGSSNFYMRTKGEMEVGLRKAGGLRRLDILQPSLLLGRRQESRPLERAAVMLGPLMNLFLHGGWRKYRAIDVRTIADAIFALSHERPAGRFTHDYDAMHYAIRRSGEFSDVVSRG